LAESIAVESKKVAEIKSTFEHLFEQPSNFTVDSKGNIYILEDLKERVLIYDKNGEFLSSFGNHTNKDIDIYKSYNIACDDYDTIHIFEPYQNAVLLFDINGTLKKTVTLDFDDEIEHKITDLAFSYNNYFLVDNENHYLYIFDTNGHITKRIGKKGELQGEFNKPFSLAIDLEGRIYITDVLNSRVQTFAPTGTYLDQIGDFGFTDGGIFRPNGVAVDNKKNVYISDALLGVIYVFNADGKYLSPLMNNGKVLKFKDPARIKFYNDKLYVLEMLKSVISIYNIL
jgi:uncharacterized phage-like protein YoqJ